MASGRIAPAEGYVAGPKRHYRRDIWATFRRAIASHRSEAHALLMPSSEGTEVDVAIDSGFREDHLHLVDRNPAIVAHLKRRFPRTTCYGVDVAAAGDRIRRSGIRLTVANLDLCGTANGATGTTVAQFMDTGVMADASWISITVLRGRERDFSDVMDLGAKITGNIRSEIRREQREVDAPNATESDRGRLGYLAYWLRPVEPDTLIDRFIPRLHRHGTYLSNAGSQSMLWGIFSLRSPEKYIDSFTTDLPQRHREIARVLVREMCRRVKPGHQDQPSSYVVDYFKRLRGADAAFALELFSQLRKGGHA